MRALDLFCGAGGATRGLQQAGFHVTGVDLVHSPRYCGDNFSQLDALKMFPRVLQAFDFIWASPPCQAHTAMRTMHNAKSHADLIPATRAMLKAAGVPYVIENVEGAPLENAVTLCGTMFHLGAAGAELRRHRIFETSFPVSPKPQCSHGAGADVLGIYGGHVRNRSRTSGSRGKPDFTADDGAAAMGVDWMTLGELSQAIPPADSLFLARQWLATKDLF